MSKSYELRGYRGKACGLGGTACYPPPLDILIRHCNIHCNYTYKWCFFVVSRRRRFFCVSDAFLTDFPLKNNDFQWILHLNSPKFSLGLRPGCCETRGGGSLEFSLINLHSTLQIFLVGLNSDLSLNFLRLGPWRIRAQRQVFLAPRNMRSFQVFLALRTGEIKWS